MIRLTAWQSHKLHKLNNFTQKTECNVEPHLSLDLYIYSFVDRSTRRFNRAAWKQSQCVASGQTAPSTNTNTTGTVTQPFVHFSNQHSLPRPTSSLSHSHHSQQSSVSISSGSVSSIASSLATSGQTGKVLEVLQ